MMTRLTRRQTLTLLTAPLSAFSSLALAQETGGDPLGTLQWPGVRQEFLGKDAFEFDARIVVKAPVFAEDAMSVPVQVDASAYSGRVARIVVVVDRNPIRKVLDFEPLLMQPKLAFRFKLQQASAVRALVQLHDGTWRVGSTLVQASGGGCTVPGATRVDGSWTSTLGQVQAQLIPDFLASGRGRLRLRVMHPMDTGLVAGIPAYYLEHLQAQSDEGQTLFKLDLFEPVSENPLLTFDFAQRIPSSLRITGRDNSALRIDAQVRA
jgi:sulfur-oxidizing protein SoxY